MQHITVEWHEGSATKITITGPDCSDAEQLMLMAHAIGGLSDEINRLAERLEQA